MASDFSQGRGRWWESETGAQRQSVLPPKRKKRAGGDCAGNAAKNRSAARGRARQSRRFSTQKRLLETQLKPSAHAGAIAAGGGGAERGVEMRDGLQKRAGKTANRRAGFAQERHTQRAHAQPQAPEQMIQCFQGEGAAQRLGGPLHGKSAEQTGKQTRKKRRVHAVARQHRAWINTEGAPAPAPAPAIGAKHPVSALHTLAMRTGTLARKRPVAVERFEPAAMRAAPLLQRKSTALKAASSCTKRGTSGFMRNPQREGASKSSAKDDGTGRRVLGSRGGIIYKGRDGADGTGKADGAGGTHYCHAHITIPPAFATALRHFHGTSYDASAVRNT